MTMRFRMRDWYWIVAGETGVYSARDDAYVAVDDAGYLAFLADGNAPVVGATPTTLRAGLAAEGLHYLGQAFPVVEEDRPRAQRARLRLTAGAATIPEGSPLAVQWTAGQDPLSMGDVGGANPERITIPAGQEGWYEFTLGARFVEAGAAANAGYRAIGLYRGLGGSPQDLGTLRVAPSPSLDTSVSFADFALLAVGDVLRVFAQTGGVGGDIDVAARITLARRE